MSTSPRQVIGEAIGDAVEVAGQWRPTDLRGLPATLRYGATLPGVALAAARARPRAHVLSDAAGSVSGAELERAVDAVAAELAARVRAGGGTEVVVCCGSHRGLVAALAAAGALGLDSTLVSPAAGAEALAVSTSGAAAIVVDPDSRDAVAAATGRDDLLDVLETITRPPGGTLRAVPRPRRRGGMRLLTSGTTGLPRPTARRGVGPGQVVTVLSLMHALGLRRDEPVLVAPPLAHGHGLAVMTASLVIGAPALLADGRDAAEQLALVRRHRAGVLAFVPAQLATFLDALEAGSDALPDVHRIATGSAPLRADLVTRVRGALGEVLVDFYGSSEVGTATFALPLDLAEAPGTVGRPATGVQVEIVDDDGLPVPTGVTGRVRISSPWRAESTVAGAVVVGDLGRLDDEGRLFLEGRTDDVVVVGGTNVGRRRVEDWFRLQPGVDHARVHPVPHPVLGHELVVVVTGEADLGALERRARAELGDATAPRRVVGPSEPAE